jgi:hypothetical protein
METLEPRPGPGRGPAAPFVGSVVWHSQYRLHNTCIWLCVYLSIIYLFISTGIYIYNTYSHYSLHSETYPLMMYMYTSGLFMQYYISVYFNGITLHMSIKAYP